MAIQHNRRGRIRIPAVLAIVAILILAAGSATQAKSYTAERFDSVMHLLPGGDLDVTETVVFRFEDGTFSYVFRELPTRRTDRIDIVSASMDERQMPFGDGTGQVDVARRSKVRVKWQFSPIAGSRHTFTLRYIVRGAVRQEDGRDVLRWRALPSEHAYTIGSSTIELSAPANAVGEPDLDTRRVDDVNVSLGERIVRIRAADIERNGWIEFAAAFPGGSVINEPPAWQQRQQHARDLAPRWALGAGGISLTLLILLVGIRQRYDAPHRQTLTDAGSGAPDPSPPAIAGAVAANGSVSIAHAMAALFSLAARGLLTITEEPRGRLGQRTFTLRRSQRPGRIEPHENALLDIVFTDKGKSEDSTSLSKARSRLTHRFKNWRSVLKQDLMAAGLIDTDRQHIHGLYGRVSLALVLLGSALFIAAGFLVRDYGPWPLLIPGSVVAMGIAGFIFQAATTPLSNEGARRRDRWLAYRTHLNEVARSKAHLRTESPAQILPFAVALGLAGAWSKMAKHQPYNTPAWFHAVSASGDNGGFPALIAAGAADGSSGGVSTGGAAGGGSSGAG